MSDMPGSVRINEEGPREGFQIESASIATARKIELINALSQTGLKHMQIVSFVNPKRVPGMADAEAVVKGIQPRPDVDYTALWLNEKGLERLIACACLVEDIVGHPLPGSVKLGGSLDQLRAGVH